jgi:hypothetical protein
VAEADADRASGWREGCVVTRAKDGNRHPGRNGCPAVPQPGAGAAFTRGWFGI